MVVEVGGIGGGETWHQKGLSNAAIARVNGVEGGEDGCRWREKMGMWWGSISSSSQV